MHSSGVVGFRVRAALLTPRRTASSLRFRRNRENLFLRSGAAYVNTGPPAACRNVRRRPDRSRARRPHRRGIRDLISIRSSGSAWPPGCCTSGSSATWRPACPSRCASSRSRATWTTCAWPSRQTGRTRDAEGEATARPTATARRAGTARSGSARSIRLPGTRLWRSVVHGFGHLPDPGGRRLGAWLHGHRPVARVLRRRGSPPLPSRRSGPTAT